MGENKRMDGKIVVSCGKGGISKVNCASNSNLFYVMFPVARGCVMISPLSFVSSYGEVKEERGSQHGWRGM